MLVLRIGQYRTVVLHDVAHNDVDIAAGDAQALHTQHSTTQVTTPHVSATLRLLGTWPKHEPIPWRGNRISPHGHPATAARPLLSSTAPMPAVQAGVPTQPSGTHAHSSNVTPGARTHQPLQCATNLQLPRHLFNVPTQLVHGRVCPRRWQWRRRHRRLRHRRWHCCQHIGTTASRYRWGSLWSWW